MTELSTQGSKVYPLYRIADPVEFYDLGEVLMPAGFACQLVPQARDKRSTLGQRFKYRRALVVSDQLAQQRLEPSVKLEEVATFEATKVFEPRHILPPRFPGNLKLAQSNDTGLDGRLQHTLSTARSWGRERPVAGVPDRLLY